MGLRILSDERADVVMLAFGITTATAAERESVLEKALACRLARLLGTVVPAESVTTSQASYQQTEQIRLVRRNESLLLQAYRQSLGQAAGTRLKVDTGWTDFYIECEDGAELLEAKGSADHVHARQALAQLLDYRMFTGKPATSLSALFPERPSQQSIRLRHDYDVDCVYLDDNGTFVRLPAARVMRLKGHEPWLAVVTRSGAA